MKFFWINQNMQTRNSIELNNLEKENGIDRKRNRFEAISLPSDDLSS